MWFRRIFRPDRAKDTLPSVPSTVPVGALLPAEAVRQLDRLQLHGDKFLHGSGMGQRASIRRKPAMDFQEHRMYVPGDDVRYVDWLASARHEHIFIKQGEQPKEATVHILLDCSASMAWGEPPKFMAQLPLAAILGYMALAHGDRLFVFPMGGGGNQALGPLSGKGQVPALLNYFRSLKFGGRIDFTQELRRFNRFSSWGGLVYALSDFLDVEGLESALRLFPIPTWNVVLLHLLHPEELEPAQRGEMELVDVETGRTANYDLNAEALQTYLQRLEEWQREIEMAAVKNNAIYSLIPTGWSLAKEVIPHLRRMRVVRPL